MSWKRLLSVAWKKICKRSLWHKGSPDPCYEAVFRQFFLFVCFFTGRLIIDMKSYLEPRYERRGDKNVQSVKTC